MKNKKQSRSILIAVIALIIAVGGALGLCDEALLADFLSAAGVYDEIIGEAEKPAEPLGEVGLEVHYIDVGQGDSILIASGGEYMLIDGGPVSASDVVYTYLEKHEIEKLDYVVCTHAHEDHVGGLSGALSFAKAETALCPVRDYNSRAFRNFKDKLKKQGVSITLPQVGDKYSLGEAEFEILSPEYIDESDVNNTSIVMRLTYGETSFIFTGDAEVESENYILDEGFEIQSDVLKLGHHGSSTSSSEDFLLEVRPNYAVICVGKDNSYGHPHREVMESLERLGIEVYRTDEDGDIIIKSDGKNLAFETAK